MTYTIETDFSGSVTVTDDETGESRFFQGDDAQMMRETIAQCERASKTGKSLSSLLNDVLSDYF